jgi:hypothetical protein
MGSTIPNEEVLKTYIAEVREKRPGVVFVAEALGGDYDYLSGCGFDLIYGMYNMQRKGAPHHLGFHEALRKKQHEPNSIREAIWRSSYLHNQVGGADIIVFNGQLDEPAPHKVFKDQRWFRGATALAYLKPGAFSHYGGVETGDENPCDEDNKIFTFNRSFKIDWSKPSEHGDFMIGLMKLRKELQGTYGPNIEMVPLRPTKDEETWVGYAIRSRSGDLPPFFVIANPVDAPTTVNIREFPEFDIKKDGRFQDGLLQPVGDERSVLLSGMSQR